MKNVTPYAVAAQTTQLIAFNLKFLLLCILCFPFVSPISLCILYCDVSYFVPDKAKNDASLFDASLLDAARLCAMNRMQYICDLG